MPDEQWTTESVLDLLPPDMLQRVADSVWNRDNMPGELRDLSYKLLAHVMHFRVGALRKVSRKKRTRYLLEHLHHKDLEAVRLLLLGAITTWELAELNRAFLAALGLHEDCFDETLYLPPPHAEQVGAALDRLRRHHSSLHMAIYLAAMGLTHKWTGVLQPFADEFREAASAHPESGPSDPDRPRNTLDDIGELDALDRQLLADLVDRVDPGQDPPCPPSLAAAVDSHIARDPGRAVSHFHRGYLHGLHSGDELTTAGAAPDDAALWALAGQVLGLARRRAWADLLDLSRRSRDALNQLFEADASCGPVCAGQLAMILWGHGHYAEATGLLSPALLARLGLPYLHDTVNGAENRLQCMAPTEARQVVELVSDAARTLPDQTLPTGFQSQLSLLLARCLRGEGRFESSLELLDALLADDHCDAASVHLHRALARARFSWPGDVGMPPHRAQADQVQRRLDGVADDLEAARSGAAAAPADYALGVRAALAGDFAAAVQHLSRARDALLDSSAPFHPGQLCEKVRLHWALSQLCTRDEACVAPAQRELQEIDRLLPLEEWPAWFLDDALLIVDAVDNPAVVELLEWLHERCPDRAALHLSDAETVRRSPALRQALETRAADASSRSPAEQWEDNALLLDLTLDDADSDALAAVLDRLEALALEHPPLVPRYVELLSTPRADCAAWDEEEAQLSLLVLWESTGQTQQAYAALRALFFRYLERGELDRAAGLLDRLAAYDLPEVLTRELTRHAPALDPRADEAGLPPAAQVASYLDKSRPVRLLVVGGDELEASWDKDVQRHFSTEFNGLEISFEHTPRTDRWERYMTHIENRLGQYHALIFTPFMRTHMGRRLRALANRESKPWFRCNGGGQASLKRTVLAAVLSLARADAAAGDG